MQKKADFERFLLQASGSSEEKEKEYSYLGEFSWSGSKHFLFQYCRRAFYFRYILAQGGWDAYAEKLHRQAYVEKYLLYFEDFLQNTVQYALCDALPGLREMTDEKERRELLLEKMKYSASFFLFRSLQFLREKGMWSDPRFLSFAELYYRDGRFSSGEELIEEAKDVLRKFFQIFPTLDMYEKLALAPAVSLRLPANFPAFSCGNSITVLQRPFLALLSGGCLCKYSFSFRQKKEAENFSEERIFGLYVQNKYPFYKGRCHTFFMPVAANNNTPVFLEETLEPEAADPEKINESAELIREYLLSSPLLKNFPMREECKVSGCPSCRFRGVCEAAEKNPD